MPRKAFQKVYLHDNYPSDISACMTIRESLWKMVSTIEATDSGGDDIMCDGTLSMDDETFISMKESHDLPVSFGKQLPHKKIKRQKKKHKYTSCTAPNGIDPQKFIEFSETRSAHNLYMGYNEVCLSLELRD
jgi:hypothetical protein